MNENSPFDVLLPAVQEVTEYAKYNINCDAVRRAAKLGKRRLVCHANTAERKIPAMYVHYIYPKKGIFTRAFVVVDGSEGLSYVTASRLPDANKVILSVVHSHAINRFVERRQYKGTIDEATQYILDGIMANSSAEDTLNQTHYIYFDGGAFLCNLKDGIQHIRTFVMNRQLYPYQRIKSLESEKETEKMKREFSFLYHE